MALTAKQEAFCLAYVETGNASEAYRRAYDARKTKPAVINVKASQVLANGKVAVRLAELRKPAADAATVTLAGHLRRLDDLSAKAEMAGQFAAAISAEVARGKASGVHVEKSEQTVTTKALPASVDEFV